MFDTHKGMCQLFSADIILFKSSLKYATLKRKADVLDIDSIIVPNGVHTADIKLQGTEETEESIESHIPVTKVPIEKNLSTQQVDNHRCILEKYDASRAFTIWTSVKLMGLDLLRKTVDKNLILAKYFNEELTKIPGVVTIPPEMSIVCFRIEGDAETDGLYQQLMMRRQVHLTTVRIEGRVWIRVSSTSMTTSLQSVNVLINNVKHAVSTLHLCCDLFCETQ